MHTPVPISGNSVDLGRDLETYFFVLVSKFLSDSDIQLGWESLLSGICL